jgi:hypothetical protein
MVVAGPLDYRFSALALAIIYAALIISFLGGLWWGLAASDPDDAPAWIWVAGVTPSLIALAACVPWAVGAAGPTAPLLILGIALLVAPLVDQRLDSLELVPADWLTLRRRLSLGLGMLTIAAALL